MIHDSAWVAIAVTCVLFGLSSLAGAFGLVWHASAGHARIALSIESLDKKLGKVDVLSDRVELIPVIQASIKGIESALSRNTSDIKELGEQVARLDAIREHSQGQYG